MPNCAEAVTAEGITKRFGKVLALDRLDLRVREGTVHGLLGPNGAGKTTIVRILTTLLRADAGRAQVAGFDVRRQGPQVRSHIGLVGQHAAVDEILSARSNLILFGRLYGLTAPAARQRACGLLDQFGLADAASHAVSTYSGGMRRRLDIASSLILSPPVLFLDEPTSGLDPRGRAEVWTSVRRLVAGGTTVLLTTQYLEEADQLAGQISIIATGRVIAEGSPAELKSRLGGDRVEIVLHSAADLTTAAALLGRLTGTPPRTDPDTRKLSGPARHRVSTMTDSLRGLHDAGIAVEDITIRQPTLEEAFLHLTGHPGDPRPGAAGQETAS
jgi:ABC-2 type transport system ATP-binding protein